MRIFVTIKRILFLFWALWFSSAFFSNLFDYLRHFNLVSPSWSYLSHNFLAVSEVMSIYNLSIHVVEATFLGVLLLEALCSVFFWLAFFSYRRESGYNIEWGLRSFTLSIILWCLFLLSEEIFIAFQFAPVHLRLLVSQIICLMAIYFLPNNTYLTKSKVNLCD